MCFTNQTAANQGFMNVMLAAQGSQHLNSCNPRTNHHVGTVIGQQITNRMPLLQERLQYGLAKSDRLLPFRPAP